MKLRNLRILGLAVLTAGLSAQAQGDSSNPGYVDFGKFAPPSSGGEFVEVQIKNNLIAMVARLAQAQEPEVAELLRGLHAVRVNVIGLTDENRAEISERIAKVRAELETKGWERIVTAQKDKEDVGVYVKTRGEEAVQGIVVTVLDGQREAVFVNIVGDLKPEKLSVVGERFNIEPLKKIGPPPEKS